MGPLRAYRSVVLGLPLLVLSLCQTIRAERLPIKIYTTADGLANNNINKIVRDSRGFLWFCTGEGLSLFDGQSFVNFGVEDGLPHPYVNDILETREGEYWIATQGGLCRFKPSKFSDRKGQSSPGREQLFEAIQTADDSSGGRMFVTLLQSLDGTIWCGTGNGLAKVQRDQGSISLRKIDLHSETGQSSFITSLLQDRFGALWIGMASGLYRRWADGSVARYGAKDRLPDDNIHDLLEDRNGKLWLGTRFKGLFELSIDAGKEPPRINRVFDLKTGLGSNWVFELYESYDGRLFAGTNAGLAEFSADERQRAAPAHLYTKRNGFSYHEINNVTEDRDGDLWLGTANGAMKIAREGFVTFDEQDGLYSSDFLFESTKGELYYFGYIVNNQKPSFDKLTTASNPVINYEGAIGHYDGSGFSWLLPDAARRSCCSWSEKPFILHTRSGQWWIGTTAGLFVFPPVKSFSELNYAQPIAHYTTRDGLSEPVVHTLYEDMHGDIWISTFSAADKGFGFSRWDHKSTSLVDLSNTPGLPSLKELLPVCFQEDSVGNLWVGFNRGIGRYRDGRFVMLGTNDGLPPGRINDLLLDSQGRLWIAASRGGLSRVDYPNADHPTFVNYATTDGLSSNQVSALTQDLYGRIYAATGRGVDQLTPATKRIRHYSTADGLVPGQIFDALRDHSGNLWFATSQGLSKFVPQPERPSVAPPIFIRGLRIGGQKISISPLGESEIVLPDMVPSSNELQVDFVGLSFAPGEKISYQYKLEGTKDDWSKPSEQATINFANLASGHYRLLVRAIGSDGIASASPSTITFTILRPIWQRWWVLLFAALTLTLLVYAIYRYRFSRLLELERVRTRIASDLHDDIGAGLSRLAILSEVARHEAGAAKVSERLSEIAQGSRQLVDSMSDIVWVINPKRDQLRDLIQRMRRFASDLLTANAIEFTFQAPEDQDMKVGADVRRQLFLIFKEAANNVARHSGCTIASISVVIQGDYLTLKIADNGFGFDAEKACDGNGLVNMRERAQLLNGKLVIESRAGVGTAIILTAPLNANVKERNARLRRSKT